MSEPNEELPEPGQGAARAGGAQIIRAENNSTIENVTQISAEIIQIFANAPVELSSCIRIAEFAQLIEDRTRAFVGRNFIFDAIDAHLRDAQFSSGYIVIRGEPGIGKTSLMAQLAKTRQYVHHFNIAVQNIRSTRDFLSNICAQLIVRYQLGYSQLPPEAVRDSGFLARLLREASAKTTGEQIVVLIDALDEAEDLGLDAGANRLYLPIVLPSKVFFVMTTREQEDYKLVVDQRRDIYLRKDDPQNVADVRHYIRSFVATNEATMRNRISQWGLEESHFESVMTAKSEGNFMYLVHVLADIRDGTISQSSLGNIDDLPIGLRQYYERHWRTMKARDAEQFERLYQPVVCMLAVVREPVSLADVEEWTKIPAIRVREVVKQWRAFLTQTKSPSGERLYRIYHASFQDFLRDEVGLSGYHDQIRTVALGKVPGFQVPL
jgi:hypothetical protein